MGIVDTGTLRRNHEAVAARLAAEAGFGRMRPVVHARLVRDVSVASTFEQYGREHLLLGDEAADRGGHETGPSPMRYLLTGVAFCLLGWIAKAAALEEVELDGAEATLRSFLDMRGEHGVGGLPPEPQWLVLEVALNTPGDPAAALAAYERGRSHCPLTALVGRAIPVWDHVTVNGRLLLDTVPAGRDVDPRAGLPEVTA